MWNDMQFIFTFISCNAFQNLFFLSATVITTGNWLLKFFFKEMSLTDSALLKEIWITVFHCLLRSYQYIIFCFKFPTVTTDAAQSKSVYVPGTTSSIRSLRTVVFRIRFKGQWSAGKCSICSKASSNISNSLKFMATLQNVI